MLHDRLSPDAAVVMLGTNDCKPCYALTPRQIAEDLRALLRVLESRVPANRILLMKRRTAERPITDF